MAVLPFKNKKEKKNKVTGIGLYDKNLAASGIEKNISGLHKIKSHTSSMMKLKPHKLKKDKDKKKKKHKKDSKNSS